MNKFVGIDTKTNKVSVTGHKMACDAYYVNNNGEAAIIDSLDDLPENIQVFWYAF